MSHIDVKAAQLPVKVGDAFGPWQHTVTFVSMFRFSAVMWNGHRTHIDYEYATQVEGHEGVVAQDYLLASYMTRALEEWFGEAAKVKHLSYRNRRPILAGDTVQITAEVTSISEGQSRREIELNLTMGKGTESVCVPATAVVEL